MKYPYLSDCHCHSNCSFDADDPVNMLCENAIRQGLYALTVTDHCECNVYHQTGALSSIRQSFLETKKAAALFQGELRVLKGIELGQPMVNPELAKSILEKHEFDYVIGSVHKIGTLTLSNVAYNAHNVEDICLNYLDAIYELADEGDFDCLGHIDMIRLYAAKQGTPLDMLEYEDQLVPILRRVIERGKGIEINTTGFRQEISTTLPNLDLLKLYRSLGGQIVTIGSDAHCTADIGSGWSESAILAKQAGFDYVTLYEKRRPILIPIE